MGVSTKIFTFLIIAVVLAISAASPIRHIDLFKQSLKRLKSTHDDVYRSIKVRRFSGDVEKVLPEHTVLGMDAVKPYLIQLERDNSAISGPEVLYPLHYHCLKIFNDTFQKLAVREMEYSDDEEESSFYDEVQQIRQKLNLAMRHLRELMGRSGVPVDADLEASVLLSGPLVDGRPCYTQCQWEQNLYIHQRFNYYVGLAHNNIIALMVRLES